MSGSTMPERYGRRFQFLAARRSGRNNAGGPTHDPAADDNRVPNVVVESPAVSKTPSPPSKRQKVRESDLLSRLGSRLEFSRASQPDPEEDPEEQLKQRSPFSLLGIKSDAAIAGQTEKLQKIMVRLREEQAATRALGGTDRELAFPDRDHRTTPDEKYWHVYRAQKRLERILEIADLWRFDSCELCFLATGLRLACHSIYDCNRQPVCEPAKRILRWLESLRIPRYYPERGGCSMCGHGFYPCREVAVGHHSYAPTLDDGQCQNKPVVRRMMAALCAWDDQILGKAMAQMTLEQDGVDITLELEARRWFEGRLRLGGPDAFWASNMICVLDQLLSAYKFQFSTTKRAAPAVNWLFSGENPALRWDNWREVQDWEKALAFLVGKCTYCAGRGYGEDKIGHLLRRCDRGGANQVDRAFGKLMYEKECLARRGCDVCHLPLAFCDRYVRDEPGSWTWRGAGRCKYSKYLLCDGIIGFYTCGIEQYLADVTEGVKDDRVFDEAAPVDDKAAVEWLVRPLLVTDVEASWMIRQLCIWTEGLEAYGNWSKRADNGNEV